MAAHTSHTVRCYWNQVIEMLLEINTKLLVQIKLTMEYKLIILTSSRRKIFKKGQLYFWKQIVSLENSIIVIERFSTVQKIISGLNAPKIKQRKLPNCLLYRNTTLYCVDEDCTHRHSNVSLKITCTVRDRWSKEAMLTTTTSNHGLIVKIESILWVKKGDSYDRVEQ